MPPSHPERPLPPALRNALDESPEAEALARTWAALDHARPAPATTEAERAADWATIQAAIAPAAPRRAVAPHHAADRAPRRPARRARWLAPVAAMVAVVAVALALALRPVAYTASPGEMLTIALPDGSSVELNSASRLVRSRSWRAERRVRLEGEAYFVVVPDERPFIVETADTEVTVLGTAFNVRARGASQTTVTVTKGTVQVVARGETMTLEAGQAARTTERALVAQTASTDHATAWRSGGFAVQDEPLLGILRELEHRYGIEIRLDNEAVAQDALTLYFPRPPNAEAIVRDLATARDLRYRRAQHGFVLY